MRAQLLLPFVAIVVACVPSPGPFRLQDVSGRVVDRQSDAPIAGAEVIEWYRGAGRGGGSQPVYHARWATTDSEGRFHFPGAVASSPRMWALKTYGPTYAFYHPRYGLQRGGGPDQGAVLLQGDAARAEQALADLQPYCRGEIDDPGARRLAELACPPRSSRP